MKEQCACVSGWDTDWELARSNMQWILRRTPGSPVLDSSRVSLSQACQREKRSFFFLLLFPKTSHLTFIFLYLGGAKYFTFFFNKNSSPHLHMDNSVWREFRNFFQRRGANDRDLPMDLAQLISGTCPLKGRTLGENYTFCLSVFTE